MRIYTINRTDPENPSGFIAQAMTIFDRLKNTKQTDSKD